MSRGRSRLIILMCAAVALALGARIVPGGTASARGHNAVSAGEDFTVPLVRSQLQPLESYTSTAAGELFGNPPAPTPPPPLPAAPAAPPPPPPQPPPDPLANHAFAGLVTIDGRQYGLLENRQTRAGEYVTIGDEVEGFRVTGVDRSGVSLSKDADARRLAMNDRYSLVPLSKDAESGPAPAVQQQLAVERSQILYLNTLNDSFISVKLRFTGNNREEVEKANNDFFAGKISQQEYDAKTSNRGGSSLWSTGFISSEFIQADTVSTSITSWIADRNSK